MDYEILFEPDMIQMKELAFKTIREGRAIKYLDILFFLHILCDIIGFNYISAVLFFHGGYI